MQFLLVISSMAAIAAAVPWGEPPLAKSPLLVARKDTCGKSLPEPSNNPDGCYTYCDTHEKEIDGEQVHASEVINCTVSSCAEAHAASITVTEGYTITGGLSQAPISASASFTWNKAKGSTTTSTFTLKEGDVGYIAFTPRLKQICGHMKKWDWSNTGSFGHCIGGPGWGDGKPVKEDTNACGTTAKLTPDGYADGVYSFCSTDTGKGCKSIYPTTNTKRAIPASKV